MLLLSFLLATAPVPEAHEFNLANDAVTVCQLRFDDQMNRLAEGKTDLSPILDMYAERAKITAEEKQALKQTCDIFDFGALGALHVLNRKEEQAESERPQPMSPQGPYITSFVR